MAKSSTAVEAIREKFLELASPVRKDLALLAQWGEAGLIDLNATVPLKDKLLPLLDTLPLVNSLILADTDGRECFMLKEASSWTIRTAGTYNSEMQAKVERLDKDGAVIEIKQAKRAFDPRTREWFAGALQPDTPGAIFWTGPYRFKTIGKLGITASIRWQDNKTKGTITIAAMDILLDTLHQFLAGIQVTPGAHIVLIRNDGTVMSPKLMDEMSDVGGVRFFESSDLLDGPVKDALAVWTKFQDHAPSTHPFSSRKKQWWASFQPLQTESPTTWIGVLIPESDLIGNIQRKWVFYSISIGALFFLSAAAVALLFWQYNKRQGSGSQAIEANLEEIKNLIRGGENSRVEFKSTIRTNLKNSKKDKAIELAWLKSITAFMNSEGGTLLVGVDDKGAVIGIGADEFENDDKCLLHVKNLIHEHIGSEFAGYIHVSLHVIDEKIIVSFTCRKCENPIFLRVGQNENFFIRSGPSTTKLSMSKMVSYLKQRK